ncbi:putative triacylglycerol lipase [Dioscorea sansibarensis]
MRSDSVGQAPAPSAIVPVAPAPGSATGGTCKTRVEIFGYPCEEHTVTTEDGYILSIQRIPNGQSGSTYAGANKTPVLLQHGLMMDGTTWLLNSPDESLGYILADNGYDVWIANSRGTIYSLGHTSLSAADPEYWNWSWDELTAYDLPATFEYVYNQTGQQQLHYVGHSLGTLIAMTSFCQGNLVNMLKSAALLGPVAYMDQVDSPLARAIYWLGLDQFDPNGEAVHNLLTKLCKEPHANCFDLLTSFTGPNCCLNSSAVEVFLDHEPQSTATKNMVHLSQMIRRGTVSKYDYDDARENMEHYGQIKPPAYNISGMPSDIPLLFGYGGQDQLADVKDVEHLLQAIQPHDQDKLTIQYLANYSHADLVMAVNAKQDLYVPILAFFNLHS